MEPRAQQLSDTYILSWADSHNIGGDYSCSKPELARLLEIVSALPDGAAICEIGVLYGRSASIYFLESLRRYARFENAVTNGNEALSSWGEFDLHLVDAWVLNEGDTRQTFERMVGELTREVPLTYAPHWKLSRLAAPEVPALDFLHIDGDHDRGAWEDCQLYLPKVKLGGTVAIHDYGEPASYPQVMEAVAAHILYKPEWQVLPLVGRLFTARRIA